MLRTAGRTILLSGALLVSAKTISLVVNDDTDEILYAINKAKHSLTNEWGNLMNPASPRSAPNQKPRLVVLGTGWAALSMIQKIDQDKVDLTIISPRPFFFYTPLLAGTATGTVSSSSIVEPIRWYCQRSGTPYDGAAFIQAECTAVDIKKKKLTCKLGGGSIAPLTVEYDFLVIAVGAETATFNIPGVTENSYFLKELEDGIAIQKRILQNLELASSLLAAANNSNIHDKEIAKLLSWIVIGGGPAGVELTAELSDFIKQEVARYFPSLVPKIQLTLIEATDRVLGAFDGSLSAFAKQVLSKRGANVLCNTSVTKITPASVEYKLSKVGTKGSVEYGMCVWAGGIARRPIVEAIARQIDPYGKIQNSRQGLVVDPYMRIKGVADKSVFAIGDCAVCGCAPTAQVAYQQGKYLGRLFRDSSNGMLIVERQERTKSKSASFEDEQKPLTPVFQYSHKGALAYTGGGKGVAELKSLWDNYPSQDGKVRVEGPGAFAIWRSLYFSKLMSTRNQAQVGFDWAKAFLFGRDISSPFSSDLGSKSGKK